MSLKAKLEAVIYAAEEPVTLAQLAALFASDALAWKAEQEAASAEEATEEADATPLLGEDFGFVELDGAALEAAPAPPPVEIAPESEETAGEEEASAPIDGVVETAPEGDNEGELKRQARQRDREVRAILKRLLDEIVASCAADSRGVEIREIAGGYRMATKPECHDAVRLFVKSLKPALKLSLAALETLAVIAYKQPVTAPEVSEIRGVETAGVLGSLLARKLIATAGRKPVIGRPILYKTTKEFLLRFGLKDIAELPSMEEFEKLASIELEEPEAAGFIPESDTAPGQNEIGWSDELESDEESVVIGAEPPMQEPDAGDAPGSAGTPLQQQNREQESPAEEGGTEPYAALHISESTVRSDSQPAEAPAAMAAAFQPASDDPVAAQAPTADQEPEPKPVSQEEPTDGNPAIDAE
jgi:segregation and condensation protein B